MLLILLKNIKVVLVTSEVVCWREFQSLWRCKTFTCSNMEGLLSQITFILRLSVSFTSWTFMNLRCRHGLFLSKYILWLGFKHFSTSCARFWAIWLLLVSFSHYPFLHSHKRKNKISLAFNVSFWSFLALKLRSKVCTK